MLKLRNEVGVFLFNTSCPLEADYCTSTLKGVTHPSFVRKRSIYCQIRLDKGMVPCIQCAINTKSGNSVFKTQLVNILFFRRPYWWRTVLYSFKHLQTANN